MAYYTHKEERKVDSMLLMLAWGFMMTAVFTTALLIDDLRKEEKYNKIYGNSAKGEYHESQGTDCKHSGKVLRRCC